MGFQLYHAISMFLGVALEFDRFLGLSPASSFGFAPLLRRFGLTQAAKEQDGSMKMSKILLCMSLGLWVGFSSSNVFEVPYGEPLVEEPTQSVFATYCW